MGSAATLNTEALDLALVSQGSTVVLLALLFILLRRQAGRRWYFHAWTNAWIALAVALAAVALRFQLFPLAFEPRGYADGRVRLIAFAYQFGKLGFLLLLLQGILLYASGTRSMVLVRWLWGVVLAVALLPVIFWSTLQAMLFWQGLCNVCGYACGAVVLLALPAARHSLGTYVMGVVAAATAALWSVYLLALVPGVIPGVTMGFGLQGILQGPNDYLDLICDMLLAFGMVLVLFEDTRREIDTAHRELRVAHERLLREAYLDALTGAYNRRAFAEGAGLEYAKGGFGAVVALDMDNLKEVNDRYGHEHGDALLRHFVTVLRRGLRASDKLYRVGGDEFLIVMPDAAAKAAGERIAEILACAPELQLEDREARIKVRASVGTAGFAGMDGIQSAMYAADRSMYAHKHTARHEPVDTGLPSTPTGEC